MLGAIAGLGLAAAPTGAQVFLNLDGFGIGSGSGTVQTPAGPVSDSVNISNLFFPQTGTQTANVNADFGFGWAQVTSASEFDSGIIRLQSYIVAQGASTCEQPGGGNCGNGSASAGVSTRATFRVSEEAVLVLSGVISAASHVDPGIGGSGISSSTSSVAVTDGTGTLFGRTVRNSNGSFTEVTIPDGGVARLFPGIDYAFTVASSGDGQAFGLNSVADGIARTFVMIRLFPPACPTVTAPADVNQCASQPPASAVFTVVASGALPRTTQWQWLSGGTWIDLTDGAIGGVGTVSGATTTTLAISGAGIAPNLFRSVVQNTCGIAVSSPAALSICRADFNCDGFTNSQDFFDFLAAFFALQPAADVNHDTFINSQDFFDFLAAFFIGCP